MDGGSGRGFIGNGDRNFRSTGSRSIARRSDSRVAMTNIQENRTNAQFEEYDYENMPQMSSVSQVEAEAAFKDDIFNSYARWDDQFGVIYIVPPGPDDIDDLKAIRGIDQAYENELHRIGIFMYKQFTIWPNETCRNISRELGTGDRLFQENWPDQARQLHFQKYREQL